MKRTKRLYLDFAAATPLAAPVARAYVRALELYGNPSAPHAEGRAAREAIEGARSVIARSLGVQAHELVFTSGGTESSNLAILGTPKGHCVTTSLEHSSVKNAFRLREEHGSRVTTVRPDADGLVSVQSVVQAVRPTTVLVSIHHVQGECGVVQRIRDISQAVKVAHPHVLVHVDAAQSPLWLDAGPHVLGADLVTYDAHKLCGPRGVGVLYRNQSVSLKPLFGGGGQERSLRPGTEHTAAIVAAGVAFTHALTGRKERARRVSALRDRLVREVHARIPSAIVLGSTKRRVANNVFVALPGVDGDYLSVLLDTHGVAVTPRTACLGTGGASETAFQLTGDESLAKSTVRMTLGPSVTATDVTRAARTLAKLYPLART